MVVLVGQDSMHWCIVRSLFIFSPHPLFDVAGVVFCDEVGVTELPPPVCGVVGPEIPDTGEPGFPDTELLPPGGV